MENVRYKMFVCLFVCVCVSVFLLLFSPSTTLICPFTVICQGQSSSYGCPLIHCGWQRSKCGLFICYIYTHMNVCVNRMMYTVQCTVNGCMNEDTAYCACMFVCVCGEYCALFDLCPQTFNEHHLRRSLKTLMSYSESDRAMEECNFPEQVCIYTVHCSLWMYVYTNSTCTSNLRTLCKAAHGVLFHPFLPLTLSSSHPIPSHPIPLSLLCPLQVSELAINLHHILLDTVKMQEFQDVSY